MTALDNVLAALHRAGGKIEDPSGRASGMLADAAGLPRTTIGAVIVQLELKNLVRRRSNSTRTYEIALTTKGTEVAGGSNVSQLQSADRVGTNGGRKADAAGRPAPEARRSGGRRKRRREPAQALARPSRREDPDRGHVDTALRDVPAELDLVGEVGSFLTVLGEFRKLSPEGRAYAAKLIAELGAVEA